VTRLLVISALALVACAGPAGDSPAGRPVRTTEVELPKSYRFQPSNIRVEVGAEVTWTNRDDFPHNVHLLDGSDVEVPLPVGESATIAFDEPGTVEYECSLHPQQMRGTILVG
jgi:plastocyanin